MARNGVKLLSDVEHFREVMERVAGRKPVSVAAGVSARRLDQLVVEKKRELDLLRSTLVCEVSRHHGDVSSLPWASNFVRYFECANGAANRALISANAYAIRL